MKGKQKWFGLICIGLFSLAITACGGEFGNGAGGDSSKKYIETSADDVMNEESSGGKVWKVVREDVYRVAGEQDRLMSHHEYEYDERGNLIKAVSAQPMGHEEGNYLIGEIKEYRHDDDGEIIWEQYTHREGGVFVYTWIEDVYDENDVLIEKLEVSGLPRNIKWMKMVRKCIN